MKNLRDQWIKKQIFTSINTCFIQNIQTITTTTSIKRHTSLKFNKHRPWKMDGFSRLSPASLKGIRSLFKRGDFLVTLPGGFRVDSHHGGVPPFSSCSSCDFPVPGSPSNNKCGLKGRGKDGGFIDES